MAVQWNRIIAKLFKFDVTYSEFASRGESLTGQTKIPAIFYEQYPEEFNATNDASREHAFLLVANNVLKAINSNIFHMINIALDKNWNKNQIEIFFNNPYNYDDGDPLLNQWKYNNYQQLKRAIYNEINDRLISESFNENAHGSYSSTQQLTTVSGQNVPIFATDLIGAQTNDILDYTNFNKVRDAYNNGKAPNPEPPIEEYAYKDLSNVDENDVTNKVKIDNKTIHKNENNELTSQIEPLFRGYFNTAQDLRNQYPWPITDPNIENYKGFYAYVKTSTPVGDESLTDVTVPTTCRSLIFPSETVLVPPTSATSSVSFRIDGFGISFNDAGTIHLELATGVGQDLYTTTNGWTDDFINTTHNFKWTKTTKTLTTLDNTPIAIDTKTFINQTLGNSLWDNLTLEQDYEIKWGTYVWDDIEHTWDFTGQVGGQVNTVTGNCVDDTDPINPIINQIRLLGAYYIDYERGKASIYQYSIIDGHTPPTTNPSAVDLDGAPTGITANLSGGQITVTCNVSATTTVTQNQFKMNVTWNGNVYPFIIVIREKEEKNMKRAFKIVSRNGGRGTYGYIDGLLLIFYWGNGGGYNSAVTIELPDGLEFEETTPIPQQSGYLPDTSGSSPDINGFTPRNTMETLNVTRNAKQLIVVSGTTDTVMIGLRLGLKKV